MYVYQNWNLKRTKTMLDSFVKKKYSSMFKIEWRNKLVETVLRTLTENTATTMGEIFTFDDFSAVKHCDD